MTPIDSLASPVFEVGGRFRNWRIERVIGRGGAGIVYLARHDLVGRMAAIKVVRAPPGARAEDAAISRFHIETELHVSLRHPNLPEFFDAELLPDGTAILVLEYLDGYDLAKTLLRTRRLPLGDALFVVTEVLRALMVMHAKSVHRDVKPSNIFLCRRPRLDSEGRLEKGRVRLLDFGIAKLKGRKGPTRQFTTIGTDCYMSPEQLNGKELDGRSDLYALGLVLYEAIVGHPLYVLDRDAMPAADALVFNHVYVRAPDVRHEVPDAPSDVAEFVARLLEKDPASRFAHTEEALNVARALRRRHHDTSKIFREDVDDVIEVIEALREERWSGPAIPVENPMLTDPIGRASAEAEPASADAPSPRAAKHDTSPAPPPTADLDPAAHLTRRGTFRMPAPRAADLPDAMELRNVEQIRELIRSPRCFLRPALVVLDSTTGQPIATHDLLAVGKPSGLAELLHSESILGSSSQADVPVRASGVESRHARAVLRRDRRLEIRLVDAVQISNDALTIDGVPAPWGGQLLHGARFTLASAALTAIDLAVTVDAPVRRTSPARLGLHDAHGKSIGSSLPLHQPLTMIGSSPACDYVVSGLADVHAVLWLRGDGRFELIDLDTSVLPHGDPIAAATILAGSTRIPLPGGRTIVLDDPLLAPNERPEAPREAQRRAPPPVVERPPEPSVPSLRTDRLVVCGKRASGLRGDLPESFDIPYRRFVIGSDRRCDIVVAHEWVNPRHVEIEWVESGRYFAKDLGSKRGTFINRKRCEAGSIADGDYLDLGGAVSMRFERGHDAPPERTSNAGGGFASLLTRFGFGTKKP